MSYRRWQDHNRKARRSTYSASGPASAVGQSRHVDRTDQQPKFIATSRINQRMRALCLTVAAVAMVACGGEAEGDVLPDPEEPAQEYIPLFWHGVPPEGAEAQPGPDLPGDLGKLEQPIWLHAGMGTEKGNSLRCSRPYAGGECQIPDRKTINIAADYNTCTSNWQAVLDDAIAEANIITQQFGVRLINGRLEGGEIKFFIYCNDDSGNNPPGSTWIDSFFGYDCNLVGGSDYVCRYENGYIDINLTSMINGLGSVYFEKTWAQQKRFVKNGILHEIFHVWGLGHSTTSCGTLLMGACANAGDLSWWNIRKQPTSTELKWLGCFNPGAATTPDPNWIACP